MNRGTVARSHLIRQTHRSLLIRRVRPILRAVEAETVAAILRSIRLATRPAAGEEVAAATAAVETPAAVAVAGLRVEAVAVGLKAGYAHLSGSAKRDPAWIERAECRLAQDFPEAHARFLAGWPRLVAAHCDGAGETPTTMEPVAVEF